MREAASRTTPHASRPPLRRLSPWYDPAHLRTPMPARPPADDRSRYLKVLGDPERLKIVEHLRAGPKSVGQLSRELDNRIANVSHHLGLLKDAGVVVATKRGRFVIYELSAALRNDHDASSLDFGCCRVDLDARHPPTPASTPDDALRQINRILSRNSAAGTRPAQRQERRKLAH